MAGLGENEFLQLQIHPGKGEGCEGSLGEIGRQRFDEFTLFSAGGFSEELAEVVVVDRLGKVVGLGGFFQIGNRKNGGAEKFLGFGSFLVGHADPAEEFQINKGKSWGHG